MFNRPRIVIAGTGSGVGKTTFTLGIMAALKRRGLTVQGFKVGPDYIDPAYHTAVTGRPSRNLDTWMSSPDVMKEIFFRGSSGADISIIEGVMGYYDGKDPRSDQASTAEISILLSAPTLLVVNIKSMARSAAAIVKGYITLTEGVPIAGVVANHAGSTGHIELVKSAIEQECSVPLLGGLMRRDGIEIPERHLGLIPAVERGELNSLFSRLADEIEASVNLDQLLEIAFSAPKIQQPKVSLFTLKKSPVVKIAVARDAAFNFYYPENLELLEQMGAELIFFSPLAGQKCPASADGLYIGGGFPEEFAQLLSEAVEVRADLKKRISEGLPTFAECGGYMFLCNSITDRRGKRFEMVGVIQSEVMMQDRLAALGYREVRAVKDCYLMKTTDLVRGHEFHYSTSTPLKEISPAYLTKGLRGNKEEGFCKDNLLAGYTHLYFPSNLEIPRRLVKAAYQFGKSRGAVKHGPK